LFKILPSSTPSSSAVSELGARPTNRLRRIGVIGAGQMGGGIAHVCALAGFEVHVDRHQRGGPPTRARSHRPQPVASGCPRPRSERKTRQQHSNVSAPVLDYALFGDCDMVIEAATEREEIKREIFKKLTPALRRDALIATNTSSISITRLASSTDRPGKFIGMHFMNPVPVMSLVELIRGIATDEDTFAASRDLALTLGKTPIAAEDFPPLSSTASCCR